MRGMSPVSFVAAVSLLAVLFLGACGDDPANDLVVGTASADNVDGYRVIFRGVVNDTLSGRAVFGEVYDPETQTLTALVELVTTEDFAGGMFLGYSEPALPAAGRYAVDPSAYAEGEDGFTLVYRQGLYRYFTARTGNVVFTAITDTLVEGTFDAVMVGEVAERGRDPVEGEVEVTGAFSARRGNPGYIIGL